MRRRVLLLSTVVLCAALAPGDVTAARPSPINRGLVTALNSVGKNLFGANVFTARTAVFDAKTWVVLDMAGGGSVPALFRAIPAGVPPNPCVPTGACIPPDPCTPLVSVGVDGLGGVSFAIDEDASGAGEPPEPCIVIIPPGDAPTAGAAPLARRVAAAPNPGLVQALDSVGKSLFGRKAWAARTRVIAGRSWVVMDLSVNTAIPTLYDVFIPPDPCIVVGIDGLANGVGSLTLTDTEVTLPPEPCTN